MRRKDYLILFALVVVAFVSVFALTYFVEASWILPVEEQTGEMGGQAAYPWPGPYPFGTKHLPTIYNQGN